ncbi:hypothetical protein FRC17_002148 [Serendipita sp. 399]|nr:hypothetical protein FRC17_002148 [Serendipita sp. 399]
MDHDSAPRVSYDHNSQRALPYNPAYVPPNPYVIYNKNSRRSDDEFVEDCNESMDSLLAGLFSAVTTALIIETYKELKPESELRTEQLLGALLERLGNNSAPARVQDIPPIPFTPPHHAMVTNITFFLSLTVSLLAALSALLVKQWTRKVYGGLRTIGSPRRLAREHYVRMRGMGDWNMAGIIAAVPIMLHVSLLLFFTGLVYWLSSLNKSLFFSILFVISIGFGLYCIAAIIPSMRPDAPFRWPVSAAIVWITNGIKKALQSTSDPATESGSNSPKQPKMTDFSILCTQLRRKEMFDEDMQGIAHDSVDLEIMSKIVKDLETKDGIEGAIDAFRQAFINKLRLDKQLITLILHKAAQAALACQVQRDDGYYQINPSMVDRLIMVLEFFQVALQRLDFDATGRPAVLEPMLELSTLSLKRAINAQSLEEIVLSGHLVVLLECRLRRYTHLNDAIEVLHALRDTGPSPKNWGDRGLHRDDTETLRVWRDDEVKWYQRLVLPYLAVLPRLVRLRYEDRTADVFAEAEGSLTAIATTIRNLLAVSKVKNGHSNTNWTELRDSFVETWMASSHCPTAFLDWMKTVMLHTGISGEVAQSGALSVNYVC